jgi:hypothetical protein
VSVLGIPERLGIPTTLTPALPQREREKDEDKDVH